MTLVLTALLPQHIIQVSDRRVVWPSRTEDERIKAIITPSFACSYTGPAELGDGDTAEWIGSQFSDHICDSDRGINALLRAVQRQANRQNLRGYPFAVVCAGWFPNKENTIPLAAVISNMHSKTGRLLHEFKLTTLKRLDGRLSTVIPIGVQLSRQETELINRKVEGICNSGKVAAKMVVAILADFLRWIARSPGRKTYVSEDVLITCIPRPDTLKDVLIVGKLVESYLSATSIKAGRPGAELPGGPIIVGYKAVIQALLPDEKRAKDGAISSAFRIVRLPPRGTVGAAVIIKDPPLGPGWSWPGTELGKDICL